MYTLNELANEGHTYAQREQLIKKGMSLLDAKEPAIETALEKMLADNDLILDGDAIYLPPFFYAEQGTASKLLRLIQTRPTRKVPPDLPLTEIERASGLHYDEAQMDAIRQVASSKVMVLTGGPGTGKTTVTQGIIGAFRSAGLTVLLATPTGRAAKRMTETTGLEAKTIHRLLEFKPPEGYQRNEDNPLEGDTLILDECSMIDVVLMNSLLKAVPPGMRLILVGDIDQLPSVGPGNVLRDIIDSGCAAVVKLTKIFRQAQSSRIIMNAHHINRGWYPDISNGRESDFFFLEDEDPEHVADQIVDLVKRRLPKAYHVPPSSIQVLTPMQRGTVGATKLNILLHDALNPSPVYLTRSGMTYRQNDKVIQIKNNYEKEVFNGDIGIIQKVDWEGRTLSVQFDDRLIEYNGTELDELTLAYATTIHKSQGSEYPIVVTLVLMTHYVMLQRNMLYTGITRAKKLLVLIGSKKALHYAVSNVTVSSRNTRLAERLRDLTE
jgi:exodeoxyribonuclease V alpha subunit